MHLVGWLNKQTDMRQLKQAREGQMRSDSGSDVPHKEKGLIQLLALVRNSRVWLSTYSHSDLEYKMYMLEFFHIAMLLNPWASSPQAC